MLTKHRGKVRFGSRSPARCEPYVLLPHVKKHMEETKIQKDTKVVIGYYEKEQTITASSLRFGPGKCPSPSFERRDRARQQRYHESCPGEKDGPPVLLYHGPVKGDAFAAIRRRHGGRSRTRGSLYPQVAPAHAHRLPLGRPTGVFLANDPFHRFADRRHQLDALAALLSCICSSAIMA